MKSQFSGYVRNSVHSGLWSCRWIFGILIFTAKLGLSRKGFPASAGTERTTRISDKLEQDCHDNRTPQTAVYAHMQRGRDY
jgi:hypothetical protein